jgi:polar amino acid transport system substrate-binding protein
MVAKTQATTMTKPADWRDRVTFAYIDEPPFARPGPGGSAEGCDVELALAGLSAIGVRRVEMHLSTFAELLPGVASGRWTMNTPLFVSAERARLVSFSRPVWALRDGLVVPAGNPRAVTSYQGIAAGRLVLALISGQIQRQSALAAGVQPAQIIEFATQHEALQAVRDGRADAYASTALGNRTVVRQAQDLASVDAVDDLDRAPPVGAFSFAHDSIELRAAFDLFLQAHLGSAEHRARMARHGLTAAEIDPVAARPARP